MTLCCNARTCANDRCLLYLLNVSVARGMVQHASTS